MYGCESWNIKKSWAPEDWYFWTVVLEKTLESPLGCKETQPVNPKGNQSWIFIGGTDAEAEGPVLGHLMWRTDSLEKTLILGKIEGMRRRGWQRMRWLDDITDSTYLIWASSKNWWWAGKPGMLQSMRSQRVEHDWATELKWPSLWCFAMTAKLTNREHMQKIVIQKVIWTGYSSYYPYVKM